MSKEAMDLIVENRDDRDTLIRIMVNSGYTVKKVEVKNEGMRKKETHIRAWKEV